MLGIYRIHGLLLFTFDQFGLVLKPLSNNLPLVGQKGVILAQGCPSLLLGYREPFVHCLLQSRIHYLQTGYPFPSCSFPLGLFSRQFLPDLRRQLLGLVALSGFDPTPNLIASVDRDRLIAVGTLGWHRLGMNFWRA